MPPPRIAVVCDRFPELSETFIATEIDALRSLGLAVRVEALARPARPAAGVQPPRPWEEETRGERLRALAALVARHPVRCVRDRRRGGPPLRMLAPAAMRVARGGERHLHAHFAATAAGATERIAALLGLPWSLTAHGYDIFQAPDDLARRLRSAAFVTSGSEYTVSHLRRLEPDANVHVVVMGVDGEVFARRTPYPGGRTVVAVGRLVEKKGFADLVSAVGLLRERGRAPDRVVIVGDGPLLEALEQQVRALGLGALVELPGALAHDSVRALLERADLFCAPCVVAADGDRDSMPVVVKEALAMEIPVVASDAVGLPEIVRPEWGVLVPPGDPQALADGVDRELSRAPEERAARGRAGRAHVLAHCDAVGQARRLAELITRAAR